MEQQLEQLYDDVIITHNREPWHFEKRQTAQHTVEAYNPLCGDKFKIFLDIEDGKIEKATFHGYGCAVSKAATSVLMKKMQGLPVDDLEQLLHSYFTALKTGNTEGGADEDIKAFVAVRQFPERMSCATLSWDAVKEFFS